MWFLVWFIWNGRWKWCIRKDSAFLSLFSCLSFVCLRRSLLCLLYVFRSQISVKRNLCFDWSSDPPLPLSMIFLRLLFQYDLMQKLTLDLCFSKNDDSILSLFDSRKILMSRLLSVYLRSSSLWKSLVSNTPTDWVHRRSTDFCWLQTSSYGPLSTVTTLDSSSFTCHWWPPSSRLHDCST